MKTKNLLTGAALMAALTIGVNTAEVKAGGKVKCYGIAKAGQNSCAANGHSCAGQATVDYDKNEWVYIGSEAECAAEKAKLKN